VKIILRKEVESLGTEGEVVTVKNGYARNYLIPKGLAIRATEGTIRAIETEKQQRAFKIEKERKSARDLAENIERLTLVVRAKAGESGKLFGAVTQQTVSDSLKTQGYDVDRKHVTIEEPIRALGNYTVRVKLFTDVFANVKVQVEAQSE
jgi:large subunit ribosomal protein L9